MSHCVALHTTACALWCTTYAFIKHASSCRHITTWLCAHSHHWE